MALSPMMQHYLNTKEQYKDCILMYRLGDFYEMFFDDAITVSKELELTLTGRDCGLAERAPMCGVPYHAVDTYVARLVEKGYNVAICEQMEDPALAKGLVERAVTRVITPGTVIESTMLEEKKNNYLLSVYFGQNEKKAGIAYADVSTGELYVMELPQRRTQLMEELARIAPTEVLVSAEDALELVRIGWNQRATVRTAEAYDRTAAVAQIKKHTGSSLSALGLAKLELAVVCQEQGIPLMSSMGAGNKLDPCAFKVADIYETKVCPLAKVMRRELRKRGVRKLKVVYSEEIPIVPGEGQPAEEELPAGRRSIPGSVAFVPSVAGLIIAGEVVKDLAGMQR